MNLPFLHPIMLAATRLAGSGVAVLVAVGLVASAGPLRGDLRLDVSRLGTNVLLTWTNQDATLEHSLVVTGVWTTVTGTVSPHQVSPTNPASFYRLRQLPSGGGPFDFRYVAPTFTTGIGDPTGCGCTSPENPNSLSTGGSAQDNGLGSVFLHTGEVTQHAADLEIPGRGFDWRFERRYRSGMSYDGPLGYGWEFNYNRRLAAQANGDVLRADGLGRVDRYVWSGGAYQSPRGFYTRLTRNLDGTFEERDRHGTVHSYRATNALGIAKLARVRDRNGNEMNFEYNVNGQLVNVVDTLGRSIAYSYNGNGRLTQVTDFAGRTLQFSYDGDGNLFTVTSPVVTGTPNGNDFPLGKTTRYTYSSGYGDARLNHNLLTVTAPNEVAVSGSPRLLAQYDTNTASTNVDRVVSLTLGGTNGTGIGAGGMLNFSYVPLGSAPSNDFSSAVSRTTVTNRNGNVSERLFNTQFNVVQLVRFTKGLRLGEPPGFTNTFAYNGDGEMIRRTNAELDTVEHTFDSANLDRFQQGNLLQIRHRPGPRGGDQTQLVSSNTYETNFNFVVTSTDARGNTTTNSYDERGNLTNTVHRISSITERWEYNAYGQVTAHVWPDNGSGSRRRDTFSYYASGPQTGYLQARVVDSGGFNLTTTYEYDAVGNVVRAVDPLGNDTLYTANALNQVVRARSAAVDTTNGPVRYQRDWFYDANDNVVRADVENRDENGALVIANPAFTTTSTNDILNDRLGTTQEVDIASSIVTAYTYDANQNRTRVLFGEATAGRDPFNTVQTLYDERDLMFRVIRAPGSASQSTSQTDYDRNGNVVRAAEGIEDAGGHAMIFTYNGYDWRATSSDPMGNVTTWHYGPNGNAVSVRVDGELTDVPGSAANVRLSETSYTYDAMDRQVRSDTAFFDPQTQLPIGDGFATTQWIYSDNSQVLATIDDNNHGSTNRYDTANRPAQMTDAKGNSTGYTYDANGNVTATVEVDKSDLGNPDVVVTTRFAYDGLNRRTEAVDNLNQTNRTAYNSRHLPARTSNRRGNVTLQTHDGLGRVLSTERLLTTTGDGYGVVVGSILTRQAWDDSGRLTRQTDPNTNTTTYTYDSLNRLTAVMLADGTLSLRNYDVHDNRVLFLDANGNNVISSYDANDRLTTNTVLRTPGVLGTTNETYQYDGLSRLVRGQNDDSIATRRYDSLSSLTRETQQLLPAGLPRTVQATFDGVGNLTRLVYPGGTNIVFNYNPLDLPALIRDDPPGPALPIATLQYVGRRLEQRKYANNTQRNPQYDPLRRVMAIKDTNILSGVVIEDRLLGWDAMNNKMLDSSFAGPTVPDNRNYHHDSARRLDLSLYAGPSPQPPTQYQLDNAGNRTNVTGAIDPGPYTLSCVLPEPADCQVNQYTTTPFDSRTYDRNGNLKSSGVSSFSYNFRNQLIQVPGLGLTNKYDCLGRRLEKNAAGIVTRFYYYGAAEIEEQNAANATAATFVWNSRAGELLRMVRGGQKYYYHGDDLGSVRKVTDSSGNVVEQYDYGDYGKPLFFDGAGNAILASAIGNPYLFRASRHDSESGLYWCDGRYLDTRAGRYLQRDDDNDGFLEAADATGSGFPDFIRYNEVTLEQVFGMQFSENPSTNGDEIPIEIVSLDLLPRGPVTIYSPQLAEWFRNRKVPDLPPRPYIDPLLAEWFRNRRVSDLPLGPPIDPALEEFFRNRHVPDLPPRSFTPTLPSRLEIEVMCSGKAYIEFPQCVPHPSGEIRGRLAAPSDMEIPR